jgi:ribosomal protein L22
MTFETPEDREELEPTPADTEAEEATEVVLEADDEAEAQTAADVAPVPAEEVPVPAEAAIEEAPDTEVEPQPAAEAPARRRRRRQGGGSSTEPAAAPRRRRERPAGPAPVVKAQARYVRSSARKARLVCDHIRGKSVQEARAILAHTPRAIARDWSKLLESAVANAEHNHSLDGEDLYVKAVHADEGPTIKRFRPRAMGRATQIRKRTSHLTILLTPKD